MREDVNVLRPFNSTRVNPVIPTPNATEIVTDAYPWLVTNVQIQVCVSPPVRDFLGGRSEKR